MERGNPESRNQARLTASTLAHCLKSFLGARYENSVDHFARYQYVGKNELSFVRVETDAGLSGLGEATLSRGWESVQHTCKVWAQNWLRKKSSTNCRVAPVGQNAFGRALTAASRYDPS
jgi:hypothetical protein